MEPTAAATRHLAIEIIGLVQGVGFRPFVYRLARQFLQSGWVCNRTGGVSLAIEGSIEQQQGFLDGLQNQLPPFAEINSLAIHELPAANFSDFKIITSATDGQPSAFVLPDLAPCPACVADMQNPDSRFFRYPFTSCSYCGPRYSIMRSQPYDRLRTSMAEFVCCPACDQDYRSPDNRRFHAQTIACPSCGPRVGLQDANGRLLAADDDALSLAIQKLKQGFIVALKGIGGFQLLVDAQNQAAVMRLRERKHRPDKPLALLIADLTAARSLCAVDGIAEQTLCSSSAPILLLPALPDCGIAEAVAPENDILGLMLPASPLHVLLTQAMQTPLVATSGNLHNEPLCHDNRQAYSKLGQIADFFLTHDRTIVRPLDDSIVRIIAGKATVLRRARGYAPLSISVSEPLPPLLAVGGHWKNSVAISVGRHIVTSQHLGDLDSADSHQQFQQTIADLQTFYALKPQAVVHDLHPDYAGSIFAQNQDLPTIPVQHHYAHVLACMAEHGLKPPVLGIAWDGSGMGESGDILGSECLLIDEHGYHRLAHLRSIRQPGGDQAAKEPRRSALAVVDAIYGDETPALAFMTSFNAQELIILKQMLSKGLNCTSSSSAGRLFDVVASLLNICHINHFEGQAAMRLEQLTTKSTNIETYPFNISESTPAIFDWLPLMESLLAEIGVCADADIAAKFHNTLAHMILKMAINAGQQRVVLSGGCFQNAYLTEKVIAVLQSNGFQVYRHHDIPSNDGGLATGQIYAAGLKVLS